MPAAKHASALPSHYDHESRYYDKHNEGNSRVINRTLACILKRFGAKSILDVSCGTGSQVFWLSKRGFFAVGVDINKRMLKAARDRALSEGLKPQLLLGDMRTVQVGKFDAVISIFNAIGHLTKNDFKKAIKNTARNLNPNGLFIFDINNLDYLLHKNNITTLTIDWQKKTQAGAHRVVQHSTIDQQGILASFTTTYDQKGHSKAKIHHAQQTLQVYSQNSIRDLLHKCGFVVLETMAVDGSAFSRFKSDRILTVAQYASHKLKQ